jgi:hypothetical protein
MNAALHAVTVQRWLSLAAIASAVVFPLAGLGLLSRWSQHRPAGQSAAIWLGGCSSLLLYAGAAVVFAVCWGGEIGESGKNRLARAYGAPVITALERYYQDRRVYPNALADLVPSYLHPEQLTAPQASVLHYPFEYRADTGSYELVVRYVGPGMNTCRYKRHGSWRCEGYF